MAKKKPGEHASGLKRKVATINGKRREFYGETMEEAIQKRDAELKKYSAPNYRDMTLAEWLDEWMGTVKAGNIDPSSLKRHEQNARIHIVPEIGNVKLADVQSQDVLAFMSSRRKYVQCRKKNPTIEDLKNSKPLSQKTLNYIYVTLNAALEKAMKLEIINRNPCMPVDAPTVPKKLPQPLDKEEKEKYLNAIAKHPLLYPLSILALDSGCRSGELLRLTWDNVYFSTGHIRIVKGKTDNAPRKIPLPERSIRILSTHKKAQETHVKQYGIRYKNNNLVFPKKDGTPIPSYSVSQKFKCAAKRAGIRDNAKFHNLRDTHATELLELGEHPFNVQERLGHGTLQMTRNYSKVTSQHHDSMIEKLNQNRASGIKVVKPQRAIKKISLRK
jgi:integrase